jgi:GT2 family glycosyltransferase
MAEIACILVNYRNPDDTLECLRSLREAGTGSFKIFLVNNYTADGSGGTLQAYLRESGMDAVYLDAGGNIGFAGGANLGIRAALAEGIPHILILNNDSVVAGDFTREALLRSREYPGEVLAGKVVDFATGGPSFNIGTISPFIGQIRHILDLDYRGEIDFVSGCLMLVPAAVFARVGLFDEKLFMYCEDADFCFRLKRGGVHIRYCPSMVIRHKFSASVKKSKTPKEYYGIRNQTYIVMRRAYPIQRFLYVFFLLLMPFYKIVRRPGLFVQAMAGAWDGLWGRMGKRHSD